MKTFLNILIAVLVICIWSDIEVNCILEKADYSVSILSAFALVPVIILRIFHRQFVEFLKQPS